MDIMRSLLFVPGTKHQYFQSCFLHGASCVIFDLEDAVPQSKKEEGRKNLKEFLIDKKSTKIGIRINNIDTIEGKNDIFFIVNNKIVYDYLIPSKTRDKQELINLYNNIPNLKNNSVQLFPLIETPQAIEKLLDISSIIMPGGALVLGCADLSAETGIEISWECMLYARSKLVMCASVFGLQIVDSPWFDLKSSEEALARECVQSKRLGFTGKLCIHPSQINVVNEFFSASKSEIEKAKKIIEISTHNNDEITNDGEAFIGPPFVKRAKKILSSCKV